MTRFPVLSGWMTVFLLTLGSGWSFADVIVRLDMDVDTTNQTWQSYLTIDDPNNETLGLAGIEFNVVGSEGLSVTKSVLRLPAPTETTDFGTFFQKGFKNFTNSGSNGKEMRGAQDIFNTASSAGTGQNSILEGVGKVAILEPNGSLPATSLASKVLIGSGTYAGTAGLLTVSGSPQLTTLLPAALPSFGLPITTFSPQAVLPAAVRVSAVPEPTFLALGPWLLIAISSIRRRRAPLPLRSQV